MKFIHILISFQNNFEHINNLKCFKKNKLNITSYKALLGVLKNYNKALLNTNICLQKDYNDK